MSRANSCLVETGGKKLHPRIDRFFFLRDQSADELKSIA